MKRKLLVWGIYLGEKFELCANDFIIGNTICVLKKDDEEANYEEITKRIFNKLLEQNKDKDILNKLHMENLVIINMFDIK